MAELSGQGPILFHGATTTVDSAAGQKLGVHGFDTEGNEYVYVDFQSSMAAGEWVVFDSAFAATAIATTSRGWVGVVISTVSASDRYGWVMVRGTHSAAWVTSDSSLGPPVVGTTEPGPGAIASPASGTGGVAVWGVAVTGTNTSGTTATTSVTGTSVLATTMVYLNYPFITGAVGQVTS